MLRPICPSCGTRPDSEPEYHMAPYEFFHNEFMPYEAQGFASSKKTCAG